MNKCAEMSSLPVSIWQLKAIRESSRDQAGTQCDIVSEPHKRSVCPGFPDKPAGLGTCSLRHYSVPAAPAWTHVGPPICRGICQRPLIRTVRVHNVNLGALENAVDRSGALEGDFLAVR